MPPTKENLQFLFSFFRVLIEGNAQRYRLDFKEERKLWDAVERVYMLEAGQRTVSNFVNIIGELKERLHRWTRGGPVWVSLRQCRRHADLQPLPDLQFRRLGRCPGGAGAPALLRSAPGQQRNQPTRQNLATFKVFLLDEAWLFHQATRPSATMWSKGKKPGGS